MNQALTESKHNGINIDKEISDTSRKFLEFCKQFGWGKLEVTIVKGEPVLSKEIEHTHRHDS